MSTVATYDPAAASESSANGGLVLRDLTVTYGTAQALFDVSLEVKGGTTLAVLGVNGAGKSTLGRALSGLVPVSGGRIHFDGADITGLAPHRVSRAGLRYIPEGRGIFPGLSVADNLRQAVLQLGKADRKNAIDETFEVFPVLAQRRSQRAGSMSGGEQQMLAMSLSLVAGPRLIIADEMSLGLAPKMVNVVFESLERARSAGITIILIEQFIHRALAFADDCAIFSRGRVTWSGPARTAGKEVLDSYLGEATDH
ncbi:ABC transporter ATP-binding protein [Streptomyces sp. GQFP]|uniref:ABC transporter ATP-binding protein n=1 Tax=Streptomyces sp. GQFP TaxID=2907545 RepID=UPI001F23BBB2|nr:ABC transporter ATP-binding protein [Streptomyces sp. GQFP]UIX29263.1 ABC transporter ATP-binding protein [Streptomyces sp. GQFP]